MPCLVSPSRAPEHAPLARRLGDRVRDDGEPSPPRRLMLSSVFGEPALPDCMAGCRCFAQTPAARMAASTPAGGARQEKMAWMAMFFV